MTNCLILQAINSWLRLECTSKSFLTLIQTGSANGCIRKIYKKCCGSDCSRLDEVKERYKHSHEQTEITTSKCVDRD